MRPVKPNEIGASLAGEQLGHFQLEEFIGGGGMGAVFRAIDNTLGRTVAVKVVSNENTDDETLKRFRNEAQSAARLDHPNIARVYYVGEDQGWNYIVFEYIEGVNIRDLVEHKGPLPLEEAVSYLLQVAEALDHASERNVVHRDIKPSNVLVMPDGRAKLVDMGLARWHHVDSPANDLTATGVTLGTFDYISPEQAKDPRSADVRSDLYSLGCTMYYMLTGMPPFPEGTVLQKLLSHSSEPPPDPRELRPEIPDRIAHIVSKLMAKQPSSRHATPRALISDLLFVADELGMAGIASRASLPRRGPSWFGVIEAYLPWAVPLILLVLVACGLDFFWRSANAGVQRPKPPALATAIVRPSRPETSPAMSKAADRVDPTVLPGREAGGESTDGDPPAIDPAGTPSEDNAERSDTASTPPGTDASPSPTLPTTAGEGPTVVDVPTEIGTDATDVDPLPVPTERKNLRLIVGRPEGFPEVAGFVVTSLEAAFRKVKELPDVQTIELAFDKLEVAPFTAELGRHITVRPAAGFHPELTFRPTNSSIANEKPMIRLIGGKLTWERTHFRVQMPYEPMDGCSLFSLDQVDAISLDTCWLTMRSEFDGTASFFSVQGPRQMMAGPDEGLPIITSPSIKLVNCVARGRATLVRAMQGLPFWLSWDNGLFSSSQRLIESSGLQRFGGAEMISVDLHHVTISSALGLCRVVIDDAAPAIPTLDLTCNHCVIRVDQNVPLIEHDRVSTAAKAELRLDRRGEQNFYAATTDVIWRIHSLADEMREYRWDDRDQQVEARWFAETSSERVIRWARPAELRSHNEYEHTLADFQLDESQSRKAGFEALESLDQVFNYK
jgi:serine/threonine-protein kinase